MRKCMAMSVIAVMILCISNISSFAAPAGKGDSQATIAVLPFTMHTPAELAYLQSGIRDMLASRLAWQGKVQVVERSLTEQALRGAKSDVSLSDAVKIGGALKADFVLFGSVTALGQSISIDAKVVSVGATGEPLSLSTQTKSLDEVIPKINQFAQDINRKIFSRSTETAQATSADSDSASVRNPEFLVPETMQNTDKISNLNPNFLELTSEGSLRQPGLWRSQTFKGGIVGMDVGDLDGDGRLEMVIITHDKLMVTQRDAYALRTLATFSGSKLDGFLWVSVADLDKDGKSEIYLTNMKKFNQPSQNSVSNQATYGRDVVSEPSSFVLTLVGNKLQVVAQNIPYFLNAVDLPKMGRVVLGQKKADDSVGTFKSDINEMQLRGGSLEPRITVALPARCNVFNFARADLKNDGNEETIIIDPTNRLTVLDPSGEQIWKSRNWFGGTSNSITGKIEDLRFNMVNYFYLPSPILVADLNNDKIKEVIANRCPDYNKLMPEGMRYYETGEIVSLSWDQMGMVENWKTREVSGMVSSIRVGDLNHDGVPELIVALVVAKDFTKLWESNSTIFTYDLNISQAKTAQAPKP
jgi:TolB-like protein